MEGRGPPPPVGTVMAPTAGDRNSRGGRDDSPRGTSHSDNLDRVGETCGTRQSFSRPNAATEKLIGFEVFLQETGSDRLNGRWCGGVFAWPSQRHEIIGAH